MAAALDRAFEALAEPTRRRMVELLQKQPRRAGDLAQEFGVTAPAMSRHLRILRECGVIEEYGVEGDLRIRMYRLRKEPFDELGAWLQKVGEYWQAQLGAFKHHAERARSYDKSSKK